MYLLFLEIFISVCELCINIFNREHYVTLRAFAVRSWGGAHRGVNWRRSQRQRRRLCLGFVLQGLLNAQLVGSSGKLPFAGSLWARGQRVRFLDTYSILCLACAAKLGVTKFQLAGRHSGKGRGTGKGKRRQK